MGKLASYQHPQFKECLVFFSLLKFSFDCSSSHFWKWKLSNTVGINIDHKLKSLWSKLFLHFGVYADKRCVTCLVVYGLNGQERTKMILGLQQVRGRPVHIGKCTSDRSGIRKLSGLRKLRGLHGWNGGPGSWITAIRPLPNGILDSFMRHSPLLGRCTSKVCWGRD